MSELKPTDTITISVHDFETKYVSREAYDALRAENERLMNDWMEDETIVGSGELRPVLSKTLKRLADLETENAALKAENAWHPASEPPESNDRGGVSVEVRGYARYYPNTHPLNVSWVSVDITHWRELPAPMEVK